MNRLSSSGSKLRGASAASLDSSVFGGPAASRVEDLFIINVGGSRYLLSQQLLATHPDTRLGKLARCSRDAALELCDDADLLENEFFFDRSSQTFRYVINFYRTGHLHVMEGLCQLSFLQEIQYWGLNELSLETCCRERYYRCKEQKETLDLQQDTEVHEYEENFTGSLCPALRSCLWDILEKPESSIAARTFGSLSIFFVVLSVINMVLISLDPGEDFGLGQVPMLLDSLEYVCVVWFTGELLLRFLCVQDKRRFSRSIPNWIDLLAILPFYVTLLVECVHGGTAELENMGRVVQVLRLLRSLRMLKLGRHSTGLKSLGLTIAQCYEEVGLLLLSLGVGISVFASTVFMLECDLPATAFTSIPAAWWWATTSMTTVGYGDIRPDSAVGKLLAFLCILSGILVLALPIAIINDRFSACYFAQKMKAASAQHNEMLRKLARASVGNVGEELGVKVNLRDAYARSMYEVWKMKGC